MDDDQDQSQNNSTPDSPDNLGQYSAYLKDMQQIIGSPVGPQTPNNGAPFMQNGLPRELKTANLLSNINLITWLLPVVGLIVSAIALTVAVKTKKFGDKRAQLRIILATIGLVLSVACTGAVAYFFIKNSSKDSTPANTYPEEIRAEYLESCAIVFDEATCSCMLQGIENAYTTEEYQAEEATVYDGTASDEYMLFLRNNQMDCEPVTSPTSTPAPTTTPSN
jgi:hypothetical protein